MLTARVKAPSQQRHPWDHYEIPGVVPAAEAFRPIDNSKNRSMF
jgi:branched-chain amino acid transport system substrate-binding protein